MRVITLELEVCEDEVLNNSSVETRFENMNPRPCSCYAYMLAQGSKKSSGKVPQEKHGLNLFLASTLKVKGPFSLGCSTGV